MKATELIKQLEGIIKESGDLDVAFMKYFEQDKSCIYDMDFSCYVDSPSPEDTVYDDFGNVVEVGGIIAISHIF